jgi:hypothetical protein
MIEFHDPRGDVATPIEDYLLSYDIAGEVGQGSKPVIGLLANGFPDSENFLKHLGDALKKTFPAVEVRLWNKGNAAIPAPENMLDEIKAVCQVAIAAYGH